MCTSKVPISEKPWKRNRSEPQEQDGDLSSKSETQENGPKPLGLRDQALRLEDFPEALRVLGFRVVELWVVASRVRGFWVLGFCHVVVRIQICVGQSSRVTEPSKHSRIRLAVFCLRSEGRQLGSFGYKAMSFACKLRCWVQRWIELGVSAVEHVAAL